MSCRKVTQGDFGSALSQPGNGCRPTAVLLQGPESNKSLGMEKVIISSGWDHGSGYFHMPRHCGFYSRRPSEYELKVRLLCQLWSGDKASAESTMLNDCVVTQLLSSNLASNESLWLSDSEQFSVQVQIAAC